MVLVALMAEGHAGMELGNPTEIEQDQKPHTSLPKRRKEEADETEREYRRGE